MAWDECDSISISRQEVQTCMHSLKKKETKLLFEVDGSYGNMV